MEVKKQRLILQKNVFANKGDKLLTMAFVSDKLYTWFSEK